MSRAAAGRRRGAAASPRNPSARRSRPAPPCRIGRRAGEVHRLVEPFGARTEARPAEGIPEVRRAAAHARGRRAASSPSVTMTSFPWASAIPPSGATKGRSARQPVASVPTTRLVPSAITAVESTPSSRASRYRPSGSMRRSDGCRPSSIDPLTALTIPVDDLHRRSPVLVTTNTRSPLGVAASSSTGSSNATLAVRCMLRVRTPVSSLLGGEEEQVAHLRAERAIDARQHDGVGDASCSAAAPSTRRSRRLARRARAAMRPAAGRRRVRRPAASTSTSRSTRSRSTTPSAVDPVDGRAVVRREPGELGLRDRLAAPCRKSIRAGCPRASTSEITPSSSSNASTRAGAGALGTVPARSCRVAG